MAGRVVHPSLEAQVPPSESPPVRTHVAGERWFHDRLVEACVGNAEGLAACVDPSAVPRTALGIDGAKAVLDGSRPVREWMIRQVSGRASIPEVDGELTWYEALHRMLPGAIIREVRLVERRD